MRDARVSCDIPAHSRSLRMAFPASMALLSLSLSRIRATFRADRGMQAAFAPSKGLDMAPLCLSKHPYMGFCCYNLCCNCCRNRCDRCRNCCRSHRSHLRNVARSAILKRTCFIFSLQGGIYIEKKNDRTHKAQRPNKPCCSRACCTCNCNPERRGATAFLRMAAKTSP